MAEEEKKPVVVVLSNTPKRTKWCPTCKRKKVLWSMERRFFICGACDGKFYAHHLEDAK